MSGKMIGLSVSFCIKDIVEGRMRIEDVQKIIGGITARTPECIEEVISQYKKSYWLEYPDKAEAIFRRLLAERKIEQPRLVNDQHFPMLTNHVRWVESEDQIIWYDRREESAD